MTEANGKVCREAEMFDYLHSGLYLLVPLAMANTLPSRLIDTCGAIAAYWRSVIIIRAREGLRHHSAYLTAKESIHACCKPESTPQLS